MKKQFLFFIFILVFHFSNAQERIYIDSLFLVSEYLNEIDTTVKVMEWNGEKQFQKVNQLLEDGKKFQKKFPVWLKKINSENEESNKKLINKLSLITQTLALYKSDLKANNYKRPTNIEDLIFLNNKIPILIRDIIHFSKMAEEKILFNTKSENKK